MNVRIRHDMSFSAGIHYAEQYQINHYTLRLWMTTNHPDPAAHNVALERVKYFVYNKLDSCVFINNTQVEQCQKYMTAGLRITSVPADPVDQIVGIMLYYKLNSIMEEHMIVVETELTSVLGDNIVYLHSDNEFVDPSIMSDWWHSADLTHCDQHLLESDKVLTIPRVSAWRDLDLAWPEYESHDDSVGNVVVFADFKNNDTN
jgi:hypothetical protein